MIVAENLRRRKGFIFPANKKEYCGLLPHKPKQFVKKKALDIIPISE